MKVAWTVLYIMASVWIVGMVMSITGVPFGKDGLYRPAARVGVVGGPAVAAPAAPPSAAAPAAAPKATPAPTAQPAAPQPVAAAEQPVSHDSVASTETKGSQPLEPRLEDGVKVFDIEAKPVKWEILIGTFVEA